MRLIEKASGQEIKLTDPVPACRRTVLAVPRFLKLNPAHGLLARATVTPHVLAFEA